VVRTTMRGIHDQGTVDSSGSKKAGPEGPCQLQVAETYLPFRALLSSVSGGRTISLPSIGKAFSSIENPRPSL